MRSGIKRHTTANVSHAKKRKERNRELRRTEEIAQAQQLGISVHELRTQRLEETRQIIRTSATDFATKYKSLSPYPGRWW